MEDVPTIERWMKLWDKTTYQYVYSAFDYNYRRKTLKLPRGIKQKSLVNELTKKYGNIEIIDRSKYEVVNALQDNYQSIKTTFKPRNKIQRKAVDFLTITPTDTRFGQKMLNLNTGEGKTFCAVYACINMGVKPLIAMDSLNLAKQWKDKIIEYTDLTEDQIYLISGKKSINNLIDMSVRDIGKIKFYIGIYRTLNDYIESPEDDYRLDITSLLYDKAKVNIKIFDEVHVQYQAILRIDYKLDRIPSVYLTATPERSNHTENILFQRIFEEVPKMKSPNKNGSFGRYRNVVVCRFKTEPTMMEVADIKKRSTRGFSFNAYNDYLMSNPSSLGLYFNALFEVYRALCKNEKTVLLVKNVNMINELVKLFNAQDYITDNSIKVLPYHSKLGVKEKRSNIEDFDLLITTDASLGKGIDIPNLTRVISTINTTSIVNVKQISGRLRYIPDKELYYIDMIDVSFTEIRRQLSAKMKYYKEMAKSINEVTL